MIKIQRLKAGQTRGFQAMPRLTHLYMLTPQLAAVFFQAIIAGKHHYSFTLEFELRSNQCRPHCQWHPQSDSLDRVTSPLMWIHARTLQWILVSTYHYKMWRGSTKANADEELHSTANSLTRGFQNPLISIRRSIANLEHAVADHDFGTHKKLIVGDHPLAIKKQSEASGKPWANAKHSKEWKQTPKKYFLRYLLLLTRICKPLTRLKIFIQPASNFWLTVACHYTSRASDL